MMLDRPHDPFSHHRDPGPLTRTLSEAAGERPKRRRKRGAPPEGDASALALGQLDEFLRIEDNR